MKHLAKIHPKGLSVPAFINPDHIVSVIAPCRGAPTRITLSNRQGFGVSPRSMEIELRDSLDELDCEIDRVIRSRKANAQESR